MRGFPSLVSIALALAACERAPETPSAPPAPAADAAGHTAPTPETERANRAFVEGLPLAERQDFDDAEHGLVAREERLVIEAEDGHVIWNLPAYDFVQGEAPASVNPSLWRQAKLNGQHGLFEVMPGIHQLRGYDIANMTLIQGASGWIVVDPLTAKETAAAALAFARKQLGEKPITGLIFTHSHVDHFGGVLGVLSAEEAKTRGVPIVAPAGFLEAATSENILAGLAMGRRAEYMYGSRLAESARGHVDTGLGKAPARGRVGILEPTEQVDHTGQELVLDGVRFVFQYVPDSEAPAELTFYLPEQKAFCGAEIVSHNLHNLYTLRGAKVRDALLWSGYIDEALRMFGEAEVVFASHHWPVWGNAGVRGYLKKQRDVYKFLHDQTLRLANAGATPREIAEEIRLPKSLAPVFADRGYYGTVRHNAKAVYQYYFGWYDGNPANLDPLPPVEAAKRTVEAMGGRAAVREKAAAAFAKGEYRWAATLLNHAVFADPGDSEAKALLAQCYDQLGYQAESGPWRDVYLTGAYELRNGAPPVTGAGALAGAGDLLAHIPVARFFDALATRLDGPKAEDTELALNLVFTDLGTTHVLSIENAVLHHHQGEADPSAAATLRLTHPFLLRMLSGQVGLREMVFSDELAVEGNRLDVLRFFSLFDRPEGSFPIVTP